MPVTHYLDITTVTHSLRTVLSCDVHHLRQQRCFWLMLSNSWAYYRVTDGYLELRKVGHYTQRQRRPSPPTVVYVRDKNNYFARQLVSHDSCRDSLLAHDWSTIIHHPHCKTISNAWASATLINLLWDRIAVLRRRGLLLLTKQRGMSVGRSVSCEPCKNGWTDRDAVWVEDAGGPREPCIRWGSRSTPFVEVR